MTVFLYFCTFDRGPSYTAILQGSHDFMQMKHGISRELKKKSLGSSRLPNCQICFRLSNVTSRFRGLTGRPHSKQAKTKLYVHHGYTQNFHISLICEPCRRCLATRCRLTRSSACHASESLPTQASPAQPSRSDVSRRGAPMPT